jgi:hypothetical protein
MAKRSKRAEKSSVEPGQAARAGVPEANVPPTTQSGPLSATGQAVRQALGQEEVPKGKERGAPQSQGQKDAKPDLIGKGGKPTGLQKEKAIFSSNGEIPSDMVASPSGLVPMHTAAGGDEDKMQQMVEDRRDEHERYVERRSVMRTKRLSNATIDRLGHAELRAIGEQRGYTLPVAGARSTRAAFARAQEGDKELGKEEI